ncbi:glycosyltransferase [Aquimarina algicola]|uniref:Glycosyltransferase family 4 protein n=1 Tax=Aquimarina algicola TaxID=2589995 RepID=A0A504J973_9FLAO|nr:glycosyltransferase [Aquimarina algicola]TPN87164.1 glycosyltransferase family 4 protein [Aquimarina algicola]
MKKVRELLKKSEIKEGLAIEKSSTDTVRLLYVSPLLNSDGYYRMILPYLELGSVDGFETRVTSVTKWDFAKTFTIGTDTLQEEEIRWADYIIFPMLTGNYTYLFQAIRVLNPNIYLVMDITRQIHNIPKSHPDHQVFKKEEQDQLLQNLILMDMITTPIKRLCTLYQEWLDRSEMEQREIEFFWLPSLISSIGFEGISSVVKPNDNIVRVGIIGSLKSAADYRYFLPMFKKIKEKYKDKVELVIFGWNGKNAKEVEVLKEVDITYHKSVSFLDYYQTLKNLHFDVVLIPMRSLNYYAYSNTIQFLEAAAIGVPVIALEHSSYAQVIDHKKNGILALKLPEWESSLIQLIEEPEFRNKLGENAKKWVWKNRSYTQKNLIHFKNAFI